MSTRCGRYSRFDESNQSVDKRLVVGCVKNAISIVFEPLKHIVLKGTVQNVEGRSVALVTSTDRNSAAQEFTTVDGDRGVGVAVAIGIPLRRSAYLRSALSLILFILAFKSNRKVALRVLLKVKKKGKV